MWELSESCFQRCQAPARQPLVTLAAAFMLGVTWDRIWPARVEIWLVAAGLCLAIWWLAWRRQQLVLAACFLVTATMLLGGARHHVAWSVFPRDDLGRWADENLRPACLEIIAIENPRWRPAPPPSQLSAYERGDQTRFAARIVRVRDGSEWRDAVGHVAMSVDGHLLDVRAGDRLRVFGHVQRIPPPLNPGEFDFATHERAERKLCRVWVDHPDAVTLVGRGEERFFIRWLHSVRDRGDALLWRYIGPRQAGLASGLLLGSREQLDRERLDPFFVTGLMHVLAISGAHIAILTAGFWLAARLLRLRRKVAIGMVIVLVVFYALLTDAQAPVVRAAMLVIFVGFGRLLGRPLQTFNALAASALVVLAVNPAELFDTGAQLSFLAVAAIALAGSHVAQWRLWPSDPLDRLIARTRPWPHQAARWLIFRTSQLLAVSAAVWAAVLPLTMFRFHIVSPEAIPLNLLLLAPVSVALFSGFAVLALGDLAPPLAMAYGWVCEQSLTLLEWILHTWERTLGVHFWTPGPAAWWVLGSYALLALWARLPPWRPSPRWTAALATVWMALGLAPPDYGFPPAAPQKQFAGDLLRSSLRLQGRIAPPELACTFIAVGHGVSVLIETPDGKTVLYDAGGMGSPSFAARAIAAVLWSRGLRHVDAVVISHADVDHYNALPELLSRFSVGTVYVSPVMFDHDDAALTALRQAIHQASVPLREISAGDRLDAGSSATIEVLHPPPRGALGTDNANSLVLHVEAWGRRLLLTGDLEGHALDDLLAEEPVDYDVALAPHHGSARSNPPGFAAWTQAEAIVISGSRDDVSELVTHAYRQAGSRVYHTAQHGAVRVTLRPEAVQVQTWRQDLQAAAQ